MSKFFKLVAGANSEYTLTIEAKEGEKTVYANGEKFERNFGGLQQGRAYVQLNGVQYEYRKKDNPDFDEFKAIAEQHNEARKADKAAASENKATNKAAAKAGAVKVVTNTAAVEELKAILDNPTANKLRTLKAELAEMQKAVDTLEKRVAEARTWSEEQWAQKFAEAARLDEEETEKLAKAREAAKRFETMVTSIAACGVPVELARKMAAQTLDEAKAKGAELAASAAQAKEGETAEGKAA